MKVSKEEVKKVVKTAVVLIASLTTISIFACSDKVEMKTEYSSISIGQDIKTGDNNKTEMTQETEKMLEENDIGSNITQEIMYETDRVDSADISKVESFNNATEYNKQSEQQYKSISNNFHIFNKDDVDKIQIPQEMINLSGNTEREIKNTLKRRDYLWDYMQDPDNFEVDYSLSDKEFILKYGTTKKNINGHKSHLIGLPYTFGEDGFPIEHPEEDAEITNPYNGKTYIYKYRYLTWEDKDNPIQRRKLTEEEARQIAKMFSDSFK